MTITREHRARLKALHARDPNFGVIGHLWARRVAGHMAALNADTLLDYGSGRSGLAEAVCKWRPTQLATNYEPAFGHPTPSPADFVTCIDVMEHVEPDKVQAVLEDIRRCARKAALVTISLRNRSPKKKDVHPNVWPRETWLAIIREVFPWAGYTMTEVEPLDVTKAKSELCVLIERQPT